MWLDIDKKADAIMQSADVAIKSAELARAGLEPPWDGFCGLVRVCDDEQFNERGVIRQVVRLQLPSSVAAKPPAVKPAEHGATATTATTTATAPGPLFATPTSLSQTGQVAGGMHKPASGTTVHNSRSKGQPSSSSQTLQPSSSALWDVKEKAQSSDPTQEQQQSERSRGAQPSSNQQYSSSSSSSSKSSTPDGCHQLNPLHRFADDLHTSAAVSTIAADDITAAPAQSAAASSTAEAAAEGEKASARTSTDGSSASSVYDLQHSAFKGGDLFDESYNLSAAGQTRYMEDSGHLRSWVADYILAPVDKPSSSTDGSRQRVNDCSIKVREEPATSDVAGGSANQTGVADPSNTARNNSAAVQRSSRSKDSGEHEEHISSLLQAVFAAAEQEVQHENAATAAAGSSTAVSTGKAAAAAASPANAAAIASSSGNELDDILQLCDKLDMAETHDAMVALPEFNGAAGALLDSASVDDAGSVDSETEQLLDAAADAAALEAKHQQQLQQLPSGTHSGQQISDAEMLQRLRQIGDAKSSSAAAAGSNTQCAFAVDDARTPTIHWERGPMSPARSHKGSEPLDRSDSDSNDDNCSSDDSNDSNTDADMLDLPSPPNGSAQQH